MSDNDQLNKDGSIRKRASLVWQYFEKLSSVRVKCRVCQHEQRYMGNTANALRHLKSKHDIDVRPVGLSDPENVKRMKALTTSNMPLEPTITARHIKKESNVFVDNKLNEFSAKDNEEESYTKRSRLHRFDSEADVDPYENNDEPLVDVFDINNPSNSKDEDDLYISNHNSKSSSNSQRPSLEDERIKAEIEYFREKAAYFRIQKHLTALQAKKLKFELEQLYAK